MYSRSSYAFAVGHFVLPDGQGRDCATSVKALESIIQYLKETQRYIAEVTGDPRQDFERKFAEAIKTLEERVQAVKGSVQQKPQQTGASHPQSRQTEYSQSASRWLVVAIVVVLVILWIMF